MVRLFNSWKLQVTSPKTSIIRSPVLFPKSVLLEIHHASPSAPPTPSEHSPLKLLTCHLCQGFDISSQSKRENATESDCMLSWFIANGTIEHNQELAKTRSSQALSEKSCYKTKCTAALLVRPGVGHWVWFGQTFCAEQIFNSGQ